MRQKHFVHMWGLAVLMAACGVGTVGSQSSTACEFESKKNTLFFSPSSHNGKAIVFIHGINGGPKGAALRPLFEDLRAAGYRVVVPVMAWSQHWEGTFEQGISQIGCIADRESLRGHEVILAGHSLGATGVTVYMARNKPSNIQSVVLVAPGYFLRESSSIQSLTASSLAQAKARIAAGGGETSDAYAVVRGMDSDGEWIVVDGNMKASLYVTYADTSLFPAIAPLFPNIEKPLLWFGASGDPATSMLNFSGLFATVPDSGTNHYAVRPGDHVTVLKNVSDEMLSWLANQ